MSYVNEAVVSSLLKKTDFLRQRVRSQSSRQNKKREIRVVEKNYENLNFFLRNGSSGIKFRKEVGGLDSQIG